MLIFQKYIKKLLIYIKGNVEEVILVLEENGVEEEKSFEGFPNKITAMILNDYGYFFYKKEDYEKSKKYLLLATKYDKDRGSINYNFLEVHKKMHIYLNITKKEEYAEGYLNATKKESYLIFDKFDNVTFNIPSIENMFNAKTLEEIFIENKLLPDIYIKRMGSL